MSYHIIWYIPSLIESLQIDCDTQRFFIECRAWPASFNLMDWFKWKFTETMRCPANARISRWGWGWHCRPSCVFLTLFQEHSSLEILIRGSDGIERFLVKSPMNLSRFGEIPMVLAVILHILSRSLSRWYFDGPITILAQKNKVDGYRTIFWATASLI